MGLQVGLAVPCLCHGMPCPAMPCPAMLCPAHQATHALPPACHAMPSHAMPHKPAQASSRLNNAAYPLLCQLWGIAANAGSILYYTSPLATVMKARPGSLGPPCLAGLCLTEFSQLPGYGYCAERRAMHVAHTGRFVTQSPAPSLAGGAPEGQRQHPRRQCGHVHRQLQPVVSCFESCRSALAQERATVPLPHASPLIMTPLDCTATSTIRSVVLSPLIQDYLLCRTRQNHHPNAHLLYRNQLQRCLPVAVLAVPPPQAGA